MALALDHHCLDYSWTLLPKPNPGNESDSVPRSLREFENDPRLPGFKVLKCIKGEAYTILNCSD